MKHTLFLLSCFLYFACSESETSQTRQTSVARNTFEQQAASTFNDSASLGRIRSFLNAQFGERYELRGAYEAERTQLNFSPIWITETFPKDLPLHRFDRAEPLGFIGEDKQRLFMHFTDVQLRPDHPLHYRLVGKSMVKNNICDFSGELVITGAREFALPYQEGIDYVVDPREVRYGVLTGTYHLFEDSTQRHVGEFKGTFVSTFMLREKGKPLYGLAKKFSDSYCNHQFMGTWSPYGGENKKPAHWGDYRIPEAGDLDIGAGEFSPNPEYASRGWDTFREAIGAWWE